MNGVCAWLCWDMILGETTTNLFLTCQCQSPRLRVTVRVAACPLEFSLISKWLHSSRLFRICPRSKFFPDIYSGIYYFFPLFTALLVSFSSRIWQISFPDCLQLLLQHVERSRSGVVTFLARHVTISRDFFSKQLLDKSWEVFYLFIVSSYVSLILTCI